MNDVTGTVEDFPGVTKDAKNKNSRMLTILATILSVVAIGLIGGGIYFVGNSKSVLIQSFGQLSSNLKGVLDTSISSELTKKIAEADKLTVKTSLALNSMFGDYTLKYNVLNDKTSMSSFIDLDLLIGDEEVIGANALINKENLYFKLKKFMDVYYFVSNEYVNFEEAKKNENIDYKKMLDVVVKDIKENIDKNDIKSSKATVKINGKDVKTTKLTYTFTSAKLAKVVIPILEDFKEDSLLTDLSKISGIEKSEISKKIDEAIDSIKKDDLNSDEVLFDYSVYYKGVNSVIKYELGDDNVLFSYVDNDKFKEFGLSVHDAIEGDTVFLISIDGNDSKYDFNVSVSSGGYTFDIDGNYEKTGDNSKFNATLSFEGQSMSLTGESKLLDKNTSKTETTIKALFAGQELFSLVLNSEIDFNANIDTSVIENAKNIENVTPEELEALQNRILNDPVISAFLEGFMGGFGSSDEDAEFEF